MCKLSINNMLWLALMSVIQNKHLPMLESRQNAVRHSQRLCSLCQELYRSVFFSFFLPLPVLKTTRFLGNFKANNGYFLANFKWIRAWWYIGKALYRSGQKCIAIRYLFKVNRALPVYRYIVAPLIFAASSNASTNELQSPTLVDPFKAMMSSNLRVKKKKNFPTDRPIPEKQGRVRGNKNIFKVGLTFTT